MELLSLVKRRLRGLRARSPWSAAADDLTSLSTTGVQARSVGWLYAVGATLALVSVQLPQPAKTDSAGLYAMIAAAYLVGSVMLVGADRVPAWSVPLASAIATAIVTLGIHFAGEAKSVYAFFYVWIGLQAFYFLSTREALLQLAWIAVAYGALLAAEPPTGAVAHWLVTVGTVAVTGLFIDLLNRRVGGLLRRLSDAVATLAEAARTDPLTNLLNRRGFAESFELELERARRGGQLLSLVICDVDRFKRVNDRYGHQRGDEVLAEVADVLSRVKRRIDTAARIGGEEFALLLPGTEERGAYVLAERVRMEVRARLERQGLELTISLGVATFPRHGDNQHQLIRAADQAMYGAKELGRDRTVIHGPEIEGLVTHAAQRRADGAEIQLATVLTLAEALDIRDSGTTRHSQDVARYAELIARRLGLDDARCERVRLGGLVHDVGKVGVSDAVLRKAGPLDEGEWIEIRKHPELGARILGGPELADLRMWVLAHHERPDGLGYPHGLHGDQIPVEARVLAVADAYEAMLADRSYRPGMPEAAAQAELRRCGGTQFDSRVVEALIDGLAGAPSAQRTRAEGAPGAR